MKVNTFNVETYAKPERTGRPSTLVPALEVVIANGEICSIPVYTSKANKIPESEQIQANRVISAMRDIAPKWRYAYHVGVTLELVLVPPKAKVPFDTKSFVKE